MAVCDPNDLAAVARCFSCLSAATLQQVQTYLLCQITSSSNSPLVYRALLSQTGTSDPTAVVLQNSIGNIIWTRSVQGVYNGTLAGAFPLLKTWTNIGWTATDFQSVGNEIDQFIITKRTTSTSIIVVQSVRVDLSSPGTAAPTDGLLVETPVEILVYS